MSDIKSDEDELKPHQIKGKAINCPHCQKLMSTKSLARHIRSVHQKVKPFKCDHCGEGFAQKTCLTYHTKSKHEFKPQAPNFKCFKCDIAFEALNDYDTHRRAVHAEIVKQRTFLCPRCPYKTYVQAEMKEHLQQKLCNVKKRKMNDKQS